MKKKFILIFMVIVTLTMTACGARTEDVGSVDVSESAVESFVGLQITDNDSNGEETGADSTEVVDKKSYTMSELIFPDGIVVEKLNYSDPEQAVIIDGGMNNPKLVMPYYTITNTSDLVYSLDFAGDDFMSDTRFDDPYFEPNESRIMPAFLYPGYDEMHYWLNADECRELFGYDVVVECLEAVPENNLIQEKVTISFESVNSASEGEINVASFIKGTDDIRVDFVIFYDELGNVISTSITAQMSELGDFFYPKEIIWDKADIYYSYTDAQ